MTTIYWVGLLLLSCLLHSTTASFGAFRGCNEEAQWGVPASGDCYAADSYLCLFVFDNGCKQITGSYLYYIGGERRDGGQTYQEQVYETVTVDASTNCGGVTECSVSVGGTKCTTCTNNADDYLTITLSDCSNLAGTFAATPQTIKLEQGGGHLTIAYNATRCQHPAITQRRSLALTASIVYTMSPPSSPAQEELSQLVLVTDAWFNDLLKDNFGLLQVFQIGPWNSNYRAVGQRGTLTVNYNATAILDPADTTTTVAQLGAVMSNATHMSWYVENAVKPSSIGDDAFADVTAATQTVAART